jgi:D-lactate dehydrogenase
MPYTRCRMRIAIFSTQGYDRRFLDEALACVGGSNRFTLVYQEAALSMQSALLAKDCDAVCVFVNDVLDAPVLHALKDLGVRAVLLRCAGFNNVDLKVAAALGFFVARVPAYSPEAVAEHAIAMIMTLNRNTHRAYNRVREGNFMLDGLLGFTLAGKTAGIIGTGRIGLATARILAGFGCTVLGYDPVPSPAFNGTMVALPELLSRADIVSLHCPLLPATRHMINVQTLALMRPGAMLVNTSRGGLIDTGAVIAALKSRRLGHLAIDVYEQESALFFHDHSSEIIDDDVFQRLMTFPNVLVTGHQGFFTVEALREISAVTLSNLICFADETTCDNILT